MNQQPINDAAPPPSARRVHAFAVLLAAVLAAGCARGPARTSHAANTRDVITEEANRAIIARAFDGWARGEAGFFDLLTDDVRWTIAGSSRFSRTYEGRQRFIAEAAEPLTSRLATPIVPTVRALYADGDVVVAVWDGAATAADGEPYRNTYNWVMTLREGRITEVLAFLDLEPYEAVLDRVPPAR